MSKSSKFKSQVSNKTQSKRELKKFFRQIKTDDGTEGAKSSRNK